VARQVESAQARLEGGWLGAAADILADGCQV